MAVRTRTSPSHGNSGGVHKGGGGGYGLREAIRNTPRRLGGGKSPLDGIGISPPRKKYAVPAPMPAFPPEKAPKYRRAPAPFMRTPGPLGIFPSLIGQTIAPFVGGWAGPSGKDKYRIDVPGFTMRCYDYKFMGPPSSDCGFGDTIGIVPATTINDCPTWHYAAQAIPPVRLSTGETTVSNIKRGFRLWIGRTRGGSFGCERFDLEHVYHYYRPSSTDPVKINIRRRSMPIPGDVPTATPEMDPQLSGLPDTPGSKRDRPSERKDDDRPKRQKPDREKPKPYQTRAMQWSVQGGGVRQEPPTNHYEMPPGPKEREKKKQWPAELIDKYYGPVTEFLDFVEVLEKSLPDRRCRGSGRTLQDRLDCLWRNWRHIDIDRFIREFAQDQAQDYLIGKLGNRYKKAVKDASDKGYWGSVRGPSISRWSGNFR